MVDQLSQVGTAAPATGSAPIPYVGPRGVGGAVTGGTSAKAAASPSAPSAAAAQVNQYLQQTQSDLQIQIEYDPTTHQETFQVVEKGSGQVLFKMPSAEVLGASSRLQGLASQQRRSGALLDQQG